MGITGPPKMIIQRERGIPAPYPVYVRNFYSNYHCKVRQKKKKEITQGGYFIINTSESALDIEGKGMFS